METCIVSILGCNHHIVTTHHFSLLLSSVLGCVLKASDILYLCYTNFIGCFTHLACDILGVADNAFFAYTSVGCLVDI